MFRPYKNTTVIPEGLVKPVGPQTVYSYTSGIRRQTYANYIYKPASNSPIKLARSVRITTYGNFRRSPYVVEGIFVLTLRTSYAVCQKYTIHPSKPTVSTVQRSFVHLFVNLFDVGAYCVQVSFRRLRICIWVFLDHKERLAATFQRGDLPLSSLLATRFTLFGFAFHLPSV